jgi:magnesium transporter
MSLVKKIKDKKVNFEFNKEYIKVVTTKIANNDALFITNSFKEMHPADAADIIEHLNQSDRESLIKLNNFKIDPEVFVELNESVQTEIITYLSSDSIVSILTNLESDDAISILENVPEEEKNNILSSLPPKDRFALLESLSYPEDTAARIMQREFTAIPSNWSVGQTIDYLRENKDLPEEFLEIFIINEEFKPIGTVPSSRVLTTSRDTKMLSIMSESQLLIPVDMDKEEVANLV